MNTKTIFKMLAAAMLMPAMLLTTACSSDDDAVNDNANTQKKYYEIPVTVTVTRQGDEGTRATYTYDEGTKKGTLSFSAGDKLFVSGAIEGTEEAYPFAGALDLVSATDGTFEGTVVCTQPYTGKAKAFLEDPNIHMVTATLLPAGYTNYGYLRLVVETTLVTEITPYTTVSNTLDDYYNSLLPLGKAEAVAQLSREYAYGYNDNGSGKVFALAPTRPVICCTISGLTANTSVSVVYNGYDDGIEISGNITTDGSGTATFAFTDFPGDYLGTLTVNGNAITLPSGVQLAAGKVYNINRSVAPAAKAAAEATAEDLGKVIGADGNIYDDVAAATAAGTTARAIIAYVGDGDTSDDTYNHGLAIAMSDANGGSKCQWYTRTQAMNCVSGNGAIATAIGYKDGIGNTNTLTTDGHTHAAATAAASNNGIAAPTGTSGWFLPSIGQWNLIVQGLATKKAGSAVTTNISGDENSTYKASNLNSVITAAGGTGFESDDYHSSTLTSLASYVWVMQFREGGARDWGLAATNYVRSVLAF